MKPNTPKVLVIGLDGATWNILNPFMKEGGMPTLKKLLKRSAHGTLQSTYPSMSPPAWTSFITGVNPGKHRIFNFLKRRPYNKEPHFFDSTDIEAKKLWHYLEPANKKALIINLPFSYPPEPVPGILITSFMTPPGKNYTHPSSVQKKLDEMGYQIEMEIEGKIFGNLPKTKLEKEQKEKLLRQISNTSSKRVQAYRLLTRDEEFDYQFICFRETDYLQHVFFDDPYAQSYYKHLDGLLKVILDHFYRQPASKHFVILISDHGFHRMPKIQFSPYVFLSSFLNSTQSGRGEEQLLAIARKLNKLAKKAGFNPQQLPFIKKARDKVIHQAEQEQDTDLVTQLGFQPTYEGLYALTEKEGDKELLTRLVKSLKQVEYKGQRVFNYVALNTEAYSGPYTKEGPDIVWQPHPEFALNMSPLATELFMRHSTHLKGDHLSDSKGIYVISGPGIKKGANIKLSINDILPLSLHFLQTVVPEGLDGKVEFKLFTQPPEIKRQSNHEELSDVKV